MSSLSDRYWGTKAEKEGNPIKLSTITGDPIAIIGVVAILFPFIFTVIAIATGAIDTTHYSR
jgi:hypothetical protein